MGNADVFAYTEQIYEDEFKRIFYLLQDSYNKIIKQESFQGDEMETFIRNILVKKYLRKNKGKFEIGYLGFEIESGEIDGEFETKGFIDIKVLNPGKKDLLNEDEYYALECKRLDGYSKKNRLYIQEGIYRFIIEKYARDMPLAGMIGFIQNGEIVDIVLDINNKIDEENDFLIGKLLKEDIIDGCDYLYSSDNTREYSNEKIKIYHIMMDFKNVAS